MDTSTGILAKAEVAGWWHEAPALERQLAGAPSTALRESYRIGDGHLDIQSDDVPFRERLRTLFRECAETEPGQSVYPRVGCTVQAPVGSDVALVTFTDPEPLDPLRFVLELFPDRGYGELPSSVPDWRILSLPTPTGPGAVALSGNRMLVHRSAPWQALVGSVAISRLFRLQRELLFLHAGAVGIGGHGVLLIGPKGAGKTTLSLAIASRGHSFLGDEIAGVRVRTMDLVPIRRSLAVRDGPGAGAVESALQREAAPYEPFPDGTRRRRSYADQLFPGAEAGPVPLRHIVFLRGFAPTPRLEAIRPGREHLGLLTPLGATLWGMPPVARARDLLKLATEVPCSLLHPGLPDETAELLVNFLED